MVTLRFEPYCGPTPNASDIWEAWNFDPFLLTVFAAGSIILANTLSRTPSERRYLGAALLVLFIAFVSPICSLSTALFSARVFHHILIVAIAAPLLAVALQSRSSTARIPLSVPTIAHTVTLWLWHLPGPYAWALSGALPYWIMEISLFGSAFWLWREVLTPARDPGSALAALLVTVIQMGFLGALLTFAKDPLFAPHLLTTQAFALSPLADQQLAGLFMWVPAAFPYLVVALWKLHTLFPVAENAGAHTR